MMYQIYIITLFPDIFPGPLGISVLKNSLNKKYKLHIIDLRKFGIGKHRIVDDAPYGGGAGLVLRPDVIHNAIESIFTKREETSFIFMSPRGKQLSIKYIDRYLLKLNLIILCGRFEGVDQRVLNYWNFEEVRVGDVVLCGGELPSMLLCEGFIRKIPGVINAESLACETIPDIMKEHDQYTRPAIWNNLEVPKVLSSGNHKNIIKWRKGEL